MWGKPISQKPPAAGFLGILGKKVPVQLTYSIGTRVNLRHRHPQNPTYRRLNVNRGGGKTLPCATCHGVGLKGVADVPNIAGRSPGQIAREIYYIQTGDRGGPSAALMRPVVENLDAGDVLAISAYVASLPAR